MTEEDRQEQLDDIAAKWPSIEQAHLEILRLQEECWHAYQAIGTFSHYADMFETDIAQQMLDNLVAAGEGTARKHPYE